MFKKFKTTTLAVVTAAATLLGSGQAWALEVWDGSNTINAYNDLLWGSDATISFASVLSSGDCRYLGGIIRRNAVGSGTYDINIWGDNGFMSLVGGYYSNGNWVTDGTPTVTINTVAFCAGVDAADIDNFDVLGDGGPRATDVGDVFGITFEYAGYSYTFGLNNYELVNTRTPITPPDNEPPSVTLTSETKTLSGTTQVVVDVQFNEAVTGFDPENDINDLITVSYTHLTLPTICSV